MNLTAMQPNPVDGKIQEPRVLLADDHSMIRRGLKIFLQVTVGCQQIGEVMSCSELLKEAVKKNYTHLILDIILKDGNSLEIIPSIRRLAPELKIMIFSMQPPEIYGPAVRQYGISHYMHKTAGEEEMLENLKKFLLDGTPESSENRINTGSNPFSTLAPRELEILHYLLKGYGTKSIGETLNLRMSTISTVKNRIFEKTKANNLKDLLELATLYNLNF
jgi:two-component system invasion response regulator UvrY